MTGPIRPSAAGITILIHVQPGAARTEIAGAFGDALKIRVAARPVDGAANEALIEFLSETFGVARRDVRVVSGGSSRRKRIEVHGITTATAERLIAR